ncbi:MAG TPA: site-2 protease family protein, partial [Candidatus Kapabacteria bacterium]|nr:site-2 protease family protein [Candidatus Kapabacteria bacterium]
MLSDQIIYFILVIGVLVTVHEFGHFLAARLCKMRTDVFSVGFGTRLLGFNKRAGFTFGENIPNKITLTMEQGSGVGGTARHLSDAETQELIEQISADVAAKSNLQIIEVSHQHISDFPEKVSVDIVLNTCLPKSHLQNIAHEIQDSLSLVLHSRGIVMQRVESAFAFEGAGV